MKLIIIISSVVLLFVVGCSENSNSNQTHQVHQKQKIPKYSKVIKYRYSFGVMDTVGEVNQESMFDSIGNVTEFYYYYKGKLSDKNMQRYDALNRVSEQMHYGADGKLDTKTIYKYDSKGNVIYEKTSLGSDLDNVDKIMYHAEEINYKYDFFNDSLIAKKTATNDKGVITITEYEYDNHNRLINTYEIQSGKRTKTENRKYYDDGKLKEESIYNPLWKSIHNTTGDTTRVTMYNKKGKIEFSRIDVSDSTGKMIEMEGFDSVGEPEFVNKYYYEYY